MLLRGSEISERRRRKRRDELVCVAFTRHKLVSFSKLLHQTHTDCYTLYGGPEGSTHLKLQLKKTHLNTREGFPGTQHGDGARPGSWRRPESGHHTCCTWSCALLQSVKCTLLLLAVCSLSWSGVCRRSEGINKVVL